MRLTEDDAQLALRGRLIGLTRRLPTDPEFQSLSKTEMLYTLYWINRVEEEKLERVERILGTYWDLETARAIVGNDINKKRGNSKPPTEMRIPLSLATGADIPKLLKEVFGPSFNGPTVAGGEYVPRSDEEIVAIGDDKDDFLDMMGGGHQIKEAAQMQELIRNNFKRDQEKKKTSEVARRDLLMSGATEQLKLSKARRAKKRKVDEKEAPIAPVPQSLDPNAPPAAPRRKKKIIPRISASAEESQD